MGSSIAANKRITLSSKPRRSPDSRAKHSSIPVDTMFRLRTDVLTTIESDIKSGKSPSSLQRGSRTGAIDPLGAMLISAKVTDSTFKATRLWWVLLPDRPGAGTPAGIERADTVTLDPHKGLFMPYGLGCLLAKDPRFRAARTQPRATTFRR